MMFVFISFDFFEDSRIWLGSGYHNFVSGTLDLDFLIFRIEDAAAILIFFLDNLINISLFRFQCYDWK